MNIFGRIEYDDGETAEFSVGPDDFVQWGAPDRVLGRSVDLMHAIMVELNYIMNGG